MGQDCRETHQVRWPENARSIANEYHVPLEVFDDNNYCVNGGRHCPPFNVETVSFWILDRSIIQVLSLFSTGCVRRKALLTPPEVSEDPLRKQPCTSTRHWQTSTVNARNLSIM